MKRSSFAFVATALAAAAVAAGWGVGTWRRRTPAVPTEVADRGQVVYQTFCASCHGPDGHGDGGSAATLRPPPRDFAARPWRTEPTPEAIRRTTRDGLTGTAMPSFRAALTDADLDAVTAHVHRLAAGDPVGAKLPSEDERLLSDAGFVSLVGTGPPPLALVDAKGRTSRLSDFAGRLVLLHFWGRACAPCLREITTLDGLERRHAGRLKVLHVCGDEDDPDDAQKVLDRLAPGAAALADSTGLGLARYGVRSLPTVWLIAPDGTAIGRCDGAKDWAAAAQVELLARWLPPAK